MDTNWNLGFTQLLRNTHPTYWGNWTLDARIAPGAVGVLDPGTGSFQFLTSLPNAASNDTSAMASDWSVKSSSVHESQTSVSLDGSYTDPETGTKITAGLKSTWSFGDTGSISSNFTLLKQSALDNFPVQIASNSTWLIQEAQRINMAPGGVITQGFGVVTSVLFASCGLNIGAQTSSSTFSIEGSVNAVNAMAGNGNGTAKGSYVSKDESAAFESHLWPSAAGTLANGPIPIAFEFASFVGGQLIPAWITNVSDISILLCDDHGGTYIVDATATYTVNGQQGSVSCEVSGGRTATMDAIPANATNLAVDLTFKGMINNDHHHFSWPTPLVTFPNGQIIIDLYGVWPGSTSAKERQTGESG